MTPMRVERPILALAARNADRITCWDDMIRFDYPEGSLVLRPSSGTAAAKNAWRYDADWFREILRERAYLEIRDGRVVGPDTDPLPVKANTWQRGPAYGAVRLCCASITKTDKMLHSICHHISRNPRISIKFSYGGLLTRVDAPGILVCHEVLADPQPDAYGRDFVVPLRVLPHMSPLHIHPSGADALRLTCPDNGGMRLDLTLYPQRSDGFPDPLELRGYCEPVCLTEPDVSRQAVARLCDAARDTEHVTIDRAASPYDIGLRQDEDMRYAGLQIPLKPLKAFLKCVPMRHASIGAWLVGPEQPDSLYLRCMMHKANLLLRVNGTRS